MYKPSKKMQCLQAYEYIQFQIDEQTGLFKRDAYECCKCKRKCDRIYSNNPDVENTQIGLCLTCAWRAQEELKNQSIPIPFKAMLLGLWAAIIFAIVVLLIRSLG